MAENSLMATSRQYWALRCATGKDYRSENLTKEEASRMLELANKKNGYAKEQKAATTALTVPVHKRKKKATNPLIEQFEERYPRIIKSVYDTIANSVLQKGSIVSVEGGGKDAKQYLMLGGGCGFAHLDYDKRSKKMKEFDEYVRNIFCEDIYHESRFARDIKRLIPAEYQQRMKASGNPIDALLWQDLEIKTRFYGECADIARANGIRCYVQSWYD